VPFDAINPQGTEVSDLGYTKPRARGARPGPRTQSVDTHIEFID
jgi:hypothetical protein